MKAVFDTNGIVEIDNLIKQHTVRLRREHRLRLPDAIIAATAVSHEATLLTNDQRLLALAELRCKTLALRDAASPPP